MSAEQQAEQQVHDCTVLLVWLVRVSGLMNGEAVTQNNIAGTDGADGQSAVTCCGSRKVE